MVKCEWCRDTKHVWEIYNTYDEYGCEAFARRYVDCPHCSDDYRALSYIAQSCGTDVAFECNKAKGGKDG